MAQALFDDHPLGDYLRGAGEEPELIPGSSAEFELELDPMRYMDSEDDEYEDYEWRPLFLIKTTELLLAVISALDLTSHPNPFAERFKYDVISSSLLAVNLPSTHGRTPRTSIPGHLHHSRNSSFETQHLPPTPPPPVTTDPSYLIPTFSVALVIAFFNAGYTLLAMASLAATMHILNMMNNTSKHDMSPSLESLNDLITSSNEWEAVVQEAISILEIDERSTPHTVAAPSSPSSSIRVALHSSLLTTQTQCDNVRQLFSALTSPSELSQLSEMYAPPSPMNNFFSPEMSPRPLSLPARRRTSSAPTDPSPSQGSKRSTWNGAYARPIQLSVPPTQVLRRREKRRSDLSSLLQVSSPSPKTMSAPVTPVPLSPSSKLPGVSEETEHDDVNNSDSAHGFGSAALELQRLQKSAGMEAFRTPPPSYFNAVVSPKPYTPASSTLSSGSRFTPIQATRHPFSTTALDHALQGALASKRYACSHLLALRFADEEDEGYWEDVRSVMGLLSTTFVDASSRLIEALDTAERQKLRDQNPTPSLTNAFPGPEDEELTGGEEESNLVEGQSQGGNSEISFAPLPSNISRFASHVEAITTALNDARDNLEECVVYLREERATGTSSKRKRRLRSSIRTADVVLESRALEAYERLRRELGLALRECERGRERLLDIVLPLDTQEDSDDSGDDLPGLGHDASDDSDKLDPSFPFDDDPEQEGVGVYAVVDGGGAPDDATSHLLLATSTQHLPPPGIEQVFEADAGNIDVFKRERSKLTREQRIQLVKARRESGGSNLGLGIDVPLPSEKHFGLEKWGPGGEVVQELKDVIWKVGERRRKLADGLAADSVVPSEARLNQTS